MTSTRPQAAPGVGGRLEADPRRGVAARAVPSTSSRTAHQTRIRSTPSRTGPQDLARIDAGKSALRASLTKVSALLGERLIRRAREDFLDHQNRGADLKLHVVYRLYGGENRKGRPPYYSKRTCLASVLHAAEYADANVVVLADGHPRRLTLTRLAERACRRPSWWPYRYARQLPGWIEVSGSRRMARRRFGLLLRG